MNKNYILFLFVIFILVGCGMQDKNQGEKTISQNDAKFYENWAVKEGYYGEYYTDYEDLFLIIDEDENGNEFKEKLLESLSFYRPDIFSNADEIVEKKISKNEFEYLINSEKKIKSINKKGKVYSLYSTDEERLNEYYKEIAK